MTLPTEPDGSVILRIRSWPVVMHPPVVQFIVGPLRASIRQPANRLTP